jgi:polysaccharide biosynthesis transport protein
MLERTPVGRASSEPHVETPAVENPLAVATLLKILRRRKGLVVVTIAAFLLGGAGYLLLSHSRYTATAQLLIDTRRGDPLPSNQPGYVDSAVVDSQVELLKSERIAVAVIRKMGLDEDPEFVQTGRLARFLAMFGLADAVRPDAPDLKLRTALAKFKRGLTVNRVGHSYVANVLFT